MGHESTAAVEDSVESVCLILILASLSKSNERHSNHVCKCADAQKVFHQGLSIAGMVFLGFFCVKNNHIR